MRDELFDRDYQAGRNALHDGIDRLIEGAANSLRVLNRINFDAPWKQRASAKQTQRRAKAA